MPTQPTSTLYRWATTLANRVAPTAAEQVSGFLGGDPVPPLTVNDILGVLSDWVEYFSDTVFAGVESKTLIYAPGSLSWYDISGTVTQPTSPLGGITVTESGGQVGRATAGAGPVLAGGTISAVNATVSGVDNTSAVTDASVSVTISDFVANTGIYSATITANGVASLSLSSGTAPTTGPLFISASVQSGNGTGNTITLDSYDVTFA